MMNRRVGCIAGVLTILLLFTSVVQAAITVPVDKIDTFNDFKNSSKYQKIVSSTPFDESKITAKEAIFLLGEIGKSTNDIKTKNIARNVITLLQNPADKPYTLCDYLIDIIVYMIFGPYEYPDLLIFLLILIYMAFCS